MLLALGFMKGQRAPGRLVMGPEEKDLLGVGVPGKGTGGVMPEGRAGTHSMGRGCQLRAPRGQGLGCRGAQRGTNNGSWGDGVVAGSHVGQWCCSSSTGTEGFSVLGGSERGSQWVPRPCFCESRCVPGSEPLRWQSASAQPCVSSLQRTTTPEGRDLIFIVILDLLLLRQQVGSSFLAEVTGDRCGPS